MIKYKFYLELWKNNKEGECCQRRTPASDKSDTFLWKPRKIVKLVNVQDIHCFGIFILSRCSLSLSIEKIDILTINPTQSPTTWFYTSITFISTLKCLIIGLIWFLNGFKSVTFVACIVHLINEITFKYIYTI